ncbi:hypothetical protein DRN63_03530 [Nanoarchaeota archaeon]|nr:MAG: hypothetical protein DRN63_03530 [Nanoarchaeota archaeon]
MRKIIGVAGTIGAGKDIVTKYIAEKYGYEVIIMGDLVRKVAKEEGLDESRESLVRVQKEKVEKFGKSYWGKMVVDLIEEKDWKKVVINGIRRVEDYLIPKNHFKEDKFVFLFVDADPKLRAERLIKRGREGDPKNWDEFLIQENWENENFDYDKLRKLYDYKIENNGTLEELYQKVDDFIKKFSLE